jgi:hypothetical protein
MEPYPVTTSREMLASIIDGIRKVSDADIIILEGSPSGDSVTPIYKTLGYDFPRVLTLDVKDCVWVEVDNPLPKPLAVPAFWVPNVILSSDYLISVTPLKVVNGQGCLTINNLMSLLPAKKYGEAEGGWEELSALGMDNVIADLYYTLPFDVGIIEAKKKISWESGSEESTVEDVGQVFVGDPLHVDLEVSEKLGIRMDYLDRIKLAESGLDTL